MTIYLTIPYSRQADLPDNACSLSPSQSIRARRHSRYVRSLPLATYWRCSGHPALAPPCWCSLYTCMHNCFLMYHGCAMWSTSHSCFLALRLAPRAHTPVYLLLFTIADTTTYFSEKRVLQTRFSADVDADGTEGMEGDDVDGRDELNGWDGRGLTGRT